MNIEEVRAMCLSLPCMEECTPFANCGSNDVVFKIGGKMFALLFVDDSRTVALKCDAERAVALREEYAGAIEPAYHCNKKYWNGVHYDNPLISEAFLQELIRHSYDEVVKKLPKKMRILACPQA